MFKSDAMYGKDGVTETIPSIAIIEIEKINNIF
jgi:hypothetical protein